MAGLFVLDDVIGDRFAVVRDQRHAHDRRALELEDRCPVARESLPVGLFAEELKLALNFVGGVGG